MEIVSSQQRINGWQKILWRERHYCNDKEYAKHLSRFLFSNPFGWIYNVGFEPQGRPSAAEVEAALYTGCELKWSVKYLWEERLEQLDRAKRKNTSIQKLIRNLQDHHWFERFISRQVLLYRGSEAIDDLSVLSYNKDTKISSIAIWLLRSIGQETTERLITKVDEEIFCLDCVVKPQAFRVMTSQAESIVYYACPKCEQSRRFCAWSDGIVAVLDRTTSKAKIEEDKLIRVNWVVHQDLFDFDWVEIIRATDEEVERFAVQVGNDTDQTRKAKYKEMVCKVSPGAQLSTNTRRILDYTFGEIQFRE